jgi:hypothetical protein
MDDDCKNVRKKSFFTKDEMMIIMELLVWHRKTIAERSWLGMEKARMRPK